MSTLDHAFDRLAARHPRFSPSVTAPDHACEEIAGTGTLSLVDACRPESLRAAIEAGRRLFALTSDKHAAQLWLYTLLGDIVAPSMTLMVESEVFPVLDLGEGTLFKREPGGYWYGLRPRAQASDAFGVGASLGRGLAPLVEALSECAGMRPAPLWAVVADGFIQPLMGAGNQEFATLQALGLACQVWAGLKVETEAPLPLPRFEQILDGEVLPIEGTGQLLDALRAGVFDDLEFSGEEPEFIFSHRVSCCMIYHSPNAGLCTSCPHQDREERLAGLIAAAESY